MSCTQGNSVMEPIPTPANARPMAMPRRRINQLAETRLTGVAETDASAPTMTPIVRYSAMAAWSAAPAQPSRHQRDAEFHHGARAGAIHQNGRSAADSPGYQKPNEKAPARDPALPPKLIDDRRKEQRKGGAGVGRRFAMVTNVTTTMTQPVKEGKAHQLVSCAPGRVITES